MKHKHHIIPKHMGGTDDPSNLIELTVEEHAEAHKVLWERHNKWEDFIAWQALAKIIPSVEVHSEATKQGMKKWWNNLTEEQKNDYKRKCSIKPENYIPHKGHTYVHTEEAKRKISAFHKGKIISEETKRKMIQNRNHATGNRNAMANPEYRKRVSEGLKQSWAKRKAKRNKKEGFVNGD